MTQPGVMPHPWWQFWQIADFLIMLAVVVFFVRFARRSDARSRAEQASIHDDAAGTHDAAREAVRDATDDPSAPSASEDSAPS